MIELLLLLLALFITVYTHSFIVAASYLNLIFMLSLTMSDRVNPLKYAAFFAICSIVLDSVLHQTLGVYLFALICGIVLYRILVRFLPPDREHILFAVYLFCFLIMHFMLEFLANYSDSPLSAIATHAFRILLGSIIEAFLLTIVQILLRNFAVGSTRKLIVRNI